MITFVVHCDRSGCEQRHSFSDEELEDGLRAIAVPLIDRSDKALAAISIFCQLAIQRAL